MIINFHCLIIFPFFLAFCLTAVSENEIFYYYTFLFFFGFILTLHTGSCIFLPTIIIIIYTLLWMWTFSVLLLLRQECSRNKCWDYDSTFSFRHWWIFFKGIKKNKIRKIVTKMWFSFFFLMILLLSFSSVATLFATSFHIIICMNKISSVWKVICGKWSFLLAL